MRKFDKGDIIKHEGLLFECIIIDEDNAVFGEVLNIEPFEKNKRTSFSKTFIVSQTVDADFDYKLSKGICRKCGLYMFEGENHICNPIENEELSKEMSFETAVRPIIRYMAENHQPHAILIVENDSAQLLEGTKIFNTDGYIAG